GLSPAWQPIVPPRDPVPPVVAHAGGPYAGLEGVPVHLDASGSRSAAAVQYAWDLDGDGAFDDATGPSADATFPGPGTFRVAVLVTDAAGHADTGFATVDVANVNPVLRVSGVTVDASGL